MSYQADFSLPKRDLQIIPQVKGEISQIKTTHNRIIKNEKIKRTISMVVFLLLALVAGGGAAALVATSGGITLTSLPFLGGAGLGVAGLGFFVTLVVFLVKTTKAIRKQNNLIQQALNTSVDFRELIEYLTDENTSKEQMSAVLRRPTNLEFYLNFIAAFVDDIKGKQKEDLTEKEQNLLSAIAERGLFVNVGVKCVCIVSNYNDLLLILETLPLNIAIKAVGSLSIEHYKKLVVTALQQPKAMYPQALAALAAVDTILGLEAAQIIAIMKRSNKEAKGIIVYHLKNEKYKELVAEVVKNHEQDSEILIALLADKKSLDLEAAQIIAIMKRSDINVKVSFVYYHLENEKYKELVAEVVKNHEQDSEILIALLADKKSLGLEAAQIRTILERMDQNALTSGVKKLGEDVYKDFVATVLKTLSEEDLDDLKQVSILTSLAASAYTSILEPKVLCRIIQIASGVTTDIIVRRLNDEQFDALVANARGKEVITALFQSPKQHRISQEKKIELVETLEQNDVIDVIAEMQPEQLQAFVQAALISPKAQKSKHAIASLPAASALISFAKLILQETLTIEHIHSVTTSMTSTEKAIFIETVSKYPKTGLQGDQLEKITMVISCCIHQIFSNGFASKISGKAIEAGDQALLTQLAHLPSYIGLYLVNFDRKNELWKAGGMLQALWETMSEQEQSIFVNTLKKSYTPKTLKVKMKYLITHYKEKTPEMLLRILAEMPLAFIFVEGKLGV